MLVRIKLREGPALRRGGEAEETLDRRLRPLALSLSALLPPAALMAVVLAGWRIAADMGWLGRFAIDRGLFSHWQVWLAIAAVLLAGGMALGRYGRGEDALDGTPGANA